MSDITELSEIRDVPILKAGNHKSRNAGNIAITEEEIDNIVEGSNALRELIKESMTTGEYRGNNIKTPFIPGPLNLHHNDFLDETMKERTKDIEWKFGKQTLDGEVWLTESFSKVPQDVAKAIKTQFPYRSVELLPLTNPDTGKEYKKVIRSTAFLDRYTPPAVKGQTPDLHVELSEGESPVMVLLSSTDSITSSTLEETDMDENKTNTPENSGQEVAELTGKLSEKDNLIAELQAEKEKESAKIAELEAARQRDADVVAELVKAQEASETREFLAGFGKQIIPGTNGEKYTVTKAYTDIVAELVSGLKKDAVIELSEGEQPAHEIVKQRMQSIVELAAKRGIVACLSTVGQPGTTPQKTVDMKTRIEELQKEDDTLSYFDAWTQAANDTNLFPSGGK